MSPIKQVATVVHARVPEVAVHPRNRTAGFLNWRRYPVWFEQALKFLSVGVLNTLLDAGLYLVLTRWLGFGAFKTLAKGISYGAGILNSFYWNKSWTFKSDAGMVAAFVPFVLSNLAALAINAGVMHLCLNVFTLHEGFSLALATGSTFVWNFTISKFFIFKT
jgi:putative flippase GtrA